MNVEFKHLIMGALLSLFSWGVLIAMIAFAIKWVTS